MASEDEIKGIIKKVHDTLKESGLSRDEQHEALTQVATMDQSQTKTVHGDEAAAIWDDIFHVGLLPHGPEIAGITRTGHEIAIIRYKTQDHPGPTVQIMSQKHAAQMVHQFHKIGDNVSARWFNSKKPGRVFVFYQLGTFLLNLDVTKDPTKFESYSVEPGSTGKSQDNLPRVDEFALAAEAADLLEKLLGGKETAFGELFHRWAKERPKPNTWRFSTSPQSKKDSTKKLTDLLEAELIQRDLDRLLMNGPGVTSSTSPTNALSSLIAATVFGTADGKIGLPSGRWLTLEDINKASKEMVVPPLVTPNNIEVAMMSLARYAAFVETEDSHGIFMFLQEWSERKLLSTDPHFTALMFLIGFGIHWRENGFARLEVGHKLAAALMFTDCEHTVDAPWPAWSLILPDGLLGEVEIRRVWCMGDRPAVLLVKLKDVVVTMELGFFDSDESLTKGFGYGFNKDIPIVKQKFDELGKEYLVKFVYALELLHNLIRGVCLAMSNPSEWRKGDYYGKPSGSEIKNPSKHKELPVGERYVFGQPVQIDLREEVLQQIRTGRRVIPDEALLGPRASSSASSRQGPSGRGQRMLGSS